MATKDGQGTKLKAFPAMWWEAEENEKNIESKNS